MMRSMFSGVSGLRVHQTKMDVIANNISNVNTVGFKGSRVTFNEVFSQNVGGASQANPVTQRGGVNPMQIGLGASVFSIDKIMTTGAAQRTDNPFDIMIQGDGFFIVGDNSGTFFSRAGNLNIDEEGNLVNANGLRVMGWDTARDADPNSPTVGQFVVQKGNAKPIQVAGDKEYVNPTSTKNIKFEGNLNSDTTKERVGTMDVYDTVGNRYVLDVQYKYVPAVGATPAFWTYGVGNFAYPNGDKTKLPITVTTTPPAAVATAPIITFGILATTMPTTINYTPVAAMQFDTNGKLTTLGTATNATPPVATWPAATATYTKLDFSFLKATPSALSPDSLFGDASALGTVNLNFTDITGFANETTNAKAVKIDGNKPGTLVGVNIGPDGKITGRYSNGELRLLAQIPIAKFSNPAGLEKVGDNLFVQTANSGDFDGIGEEVQAGGGKMLGGVLEMSNVDLSQEFTEMITTQRGFQANSRVITTSDEMLQELVNLKR